MSQSIESDLRELASLEVVSSMLAVICKTTGMGFAAVARVTDERWVALAVHDEIEFGLKPGAELPLRTTLCHEVRQTLASVVIDHASEDPVYHDHHTPRIYGIESYISVPIVLSDGQYYGNLCAIDPKPAELKARGTLELFRLLAQLVATQLENSRARSAAEAAVIDAKTVSELREQFIAVLGHDLRNPLQAILSAAALLERRAVDERERGLTLQIRSSATRISALTDDMLDFARGRLGGGIEVDFAEVTDLGTQLEQVVQEIRAGVHREVRAAITIQQRVKCDAVRIQQLASNLLANAEVHGAKDAPIEFAASIDGGILSIEVRNQGEPIPAELVPRLFAPFQRGDETSGSKQGLGLGLFICSQIVRAHGGTLEVTSTVEDGTRFRAAMPTGMAD